MYKRQEFDLVFVVGKGPTHIELVEANFVGAVGVGEITGHGHEPSFANRVGKHVGLSAVSEDATDIDDTAFAFFKRGEEVANELDRCSQVDCNNAVEKSDIGLLQISARRKGRIVDEAIDFSKTVEGSSGDSRRTFGILKITLYEGRVFRSKFFSNGIGSFDITSMENDFGTFLCEEAGHRGADPGGATGDEDLSLIHISEPTRR